ncbi:MAG TPA: hypothetical protein VMD49_08250 [Steroidobacteraceae bacterium]|nr:hypothetical protein [Steroidobacteraceae bacterium]
MTITGKRVPDEGALKRAISGFVHSRATLSPRSGQIGRWVTPLCPQTLGLQGQYENYIDQRIAEVAQRVGAPPRRGRDACTPNVRIVFTRSPQAVLDAARHGAPWIFGYGRAALKDRARMHHAIEAWYVTSTGDENSATEQIDTSFSIVVHREGRYPSRLKDVESHFRYVFVVADLTKLGSYPLAPVADYLAMIALTHTALDGCNELPSIIDLMSPDCGSRHRPQRLTSTDEAYLKALYSSRFGVRVNFEQSELRDKVLQSVR